MIADDVMLGEGVVITHPDLVNLYGCEVGANSRIGPFVEVQRGVVIGPSCKISSHSFVCTGVRIGAGVFIGHGVMFVNDLRPKAADDAGRLLGGDDWEMVETVVDDGASIGSGSTILGGIRIGRNALVGAGAVVTRDVPDDTTVVGNPARPIERT